MNVEPCNVCGSTDVNLVDGFYYCVECGTQDVNVRETVIEDRALADGTFTLRTHQKVVKATEETQELSGEWHKWHAFNFILCGLADELIAAGAKPSFKKKLLWLWIKYIKLFQNKDELGLTKEVKENTQNEVEEVAEVSEYEDADEDSMPRRRKMKRRKDYRALKMTTDLTVVTKGLLCGLLHAALNLDKSDIQLSDLIRLMKEGHVDFTNCLKYVPKEINFKLVPNYERFKKSVVTYRLLTINTLAIFKCLNVDPILPDLRGMVDRYIKELCLPNDFKNLVFSLMDLAPCDIFLDVDRSATKTMLRMPAYEFTIMGYILVAFKLCFGLDDQYERKLSDAVEKINADNCYLKSYNLGGVCEPTDRLFSFREWCSYIQLRKIMLCKYYLYMAEEFSLSINDYVYMEHCQRRQVRKKKLSDEITMNLLDKIPLTSAVEVIPRNEFRPTLTRFSDYTDLVSQYIKDPDLKLLFCEDFTQYSLKYACETLHLSDGDDAKNIILGVEETNKVINKEIYGRLKDSAHDVRMVYVRNCDNKNWLKTNQPSAEHVQKVKKNDKDSDHGYDSTRENTPEIEISSKDEESSNHDSAVNADVNLDVEKKIEMVDEEDPNENIFDDDFQDLVFVDEEKVLKENEIKSEPVDNQERIDDDDEPFPDNIDSKSNVSYDDSELFFNPNTFNRANAIKELILATCKKYKIRIPDEYNTEDPRKRKSNFLNDTAGESGSKRRKIDDSQASRRCKPTALKEDVNKLIAEYYNNLQHDVMFQVSEHVKKVVNNVSQGQQIEPEENEVEAIEQETDMVADAINFDDVDTVAEEDNRNVDTVENLDAVENVDNIDLEQSSLQVAEGEEREDSSQLVKDDPRFNEKEYDVNQLYVKVPAEEDSDVEDWCGITKDPELLAIMDKKIAEADAGEIPIVEPEPDSQKDTMLFDSDDDDLPLSIVKYHKEIMEQERVRHDNMPNLISKQDHITEFKYWTRFYASSKLRKLYELNEPFNMELHDNFPVSFLFVIRECAGILDCTPYHLYKSMVALELRMLCHNH